MSAKGDQRSGWSELDAAQAQPGPDWRVAKSWVKVRDEDVLCATDPIGLRHLLVPFPLDAAQVVDKRSSGVHLVTRVLEDDVGSHRYLDLACQRAHLTRIFEHLADDVLAHLRGGEIDVASVCISVLSRWRELLTPEPGELLTKQQLAGLFGELEQLRQLCAITPTLVTAWHGPTGARHDFTAPGFAIEVKSTLSRDGWRVRIHGLTQLEARAGEALVLRVFRLEGNGTAGKTVGQVVTELLEMGVSRADLLERLVAAGYFIVDEDHYSRFRFEVVDERTHMVSDCTPRIVSGSFVSGKAPNAVEEIEYTIDLAASIEDVMTEPAIKELLTAFARSAQRAVGP